MPSVQELENQIAELQKQRKTALRDERNKDLSLVKEMCKKHGFTQRMLKGYLAEARNRKKKQRQKLLPKANFAQKYKKQEK